MAVSQSSELCILPQSMDDEVNNKKKKAKARQQKLLAQMTSNQQAFLQNPSNKIDIEGFMPGTSVVRDLDMTREEDAIIRTGLIDFESGEEKCKLVEEMMYDCCICRLTSSSTPERPIGAVTLLQATSGKIL